MSRRDNLLLIGKGTYLLAAAQPTDTEMVPSAERFLLTDELLGKKEEDPRRGRSEEPRYSTIRTEEHDSRWQHAD